MLIKSLKKTLRDIDKKLDWDSQNHFSKFEINSEVKQKINSCFDIEEAERKCLLCDLGEIESEIHFLTRCPV